MGTCGPGASGTVGSLPHKAERLDPDLVSGVADGPLPRLVALVLVAVRNSRGPVGQPASSSSGHPSLPWRRSDPHTPPRTVCTHVLCAGQCPPGPVSGCTRVSRARGSTARTRLRHLSPLSQLLIPIRSVVCQPLPGCPSALRFTPTFRTLPEGHGADTD